MMYIKQLLRKTKAVLRISTTVVNKIFLAVLEMNVMVTDITKTTPAAILYIYILDFILRM